MITSPKDFEYFENKLEGLSYVLIGNRGVNPILFPEVYNKDGSVNYNLAVNLYGSAHNKSKISRLCGRTCRTRDSYLGKAK